MPSSTTTKKKSSTSDEIWLRNVAQFAVIFVGICDLLIMTVSASAKQTDLLLDHDVDTKSTLQGLHFVALACHVALPVPVYFAARAQYGDGFKAYQPLQGGTLFVVLEAFGFVVYIMGWVTRWSEMFSVASSTSSSTSTNNNNNNGADDAAVMSNSGGGGGLPELAVRLLLLPVMSAVSASRSCPSYLAAALQPLLNNPVALAAALVRFVHTLSTAVFFLAAVHAFRPRKGASARRDASLSSSSSSSKKQKEGSTTSGGSNKDKQQKKKGSNSSGIGMSAVNLFRDILSLAVGKAPPTAPASADASSVSDYEEEHEAASSSLLTVRGSIYATLLVMVVNISLAISGIHTASAHHVRVFYLWQVPLPIFHKTIHIMHVTAAVVAHHLFGFANFADFRSFQPFVGPKRYVFVQQVAWTIFGVSSLLFSALEFPLHAGVIPLEPWAAAFATSTAAAALLLFCSCCRYLYWRDTARYFRESARPSDVARVSLLMSIVIGGAFALFWFVAPQLKVKGELQQQQEHADVVTRSWGDVPVFMQRALRVLAGTALLVAPVSQAIGMLLLPVSSGAVSIADLLRSGNSNNMNSNSRDHSPGSSQRDENDHHHHHHNRYHYSNENNFFWLMVQKFVLLFIANITWVFALGVFFVAANTRLSSAMVISLCALAQTVYYPVLRQTASGAAATDQDSSPSGVNRKLNMLPSAAAAAATTTTETPPRSARTAAAAAAASKADPSLLSLRYDHAGATGSGTSGDDEDDTAILSSPKLRRAFEGFHVGSAVAGSGLLALSMSLFCFALAFRWCIPVIYGAHLVGSRDPADDARRGIPWFLRAFSEFLLGRGPFSRIDADPAEGRNPRELHASWSLLGQFGLSCAFFAFTMSAPLAHSAIRGLRGLMLNPFTGTPLFAATQVSSWLAHLVSFCSLLYLMVNDLLPHGGKTDEDSRIFFGVPAAKGRDLSSRRFIAGVGNAMLETSAMVLPYALSLASVMTFESMQRRRAEKREQQQVSFESSRTSGGTTPQLPPESSSTLMLLQNAAALPRGDREALLKFRDSLLLESSQQQEEKQQPGGGEKKSKESKKQQQQQQKQKQRDGHEQLRHLLDSLLEARPPPPLPLPFPAGNGGGGGGVHRHRRTAPSSNTSGGGGSADQDDDEKHVHPTVLILVVFLLSCASFLLTLMGEKTLQATSTGEQPDVALVFIPAALGLLTSVGGITVAHAFLGPVLNEDSDDDFLQAGGGSTDKDRARYVLWMPFRGGKRFIGLQILGFSSWTAAIVLTIFCCMAVLQQSRGHTAATSSLSLIPPALFGGIAPIIIAFSAAFFKQRPARDANEEKLRLIDSDFTPIRKMQKNRKDGQQQQQQQQQQHSAVVQQKYDDYLSLSLYDNSEAIICLLVLFGGWFIARQTEQLDNTATDLASATAPVVIVCILVTIAAPLTVISLRKSARVWAERQEQLNEEAREDQAQEGETPARTAQVAAAAVSNKSKASSLHQQKQKTKGAPKSSSSSSSLLTPPLLILESLLVLICCIIPVGVAYLLWTVVYSASATGLELYGTLSTGLRALVLVLQLGILVMLYSRGFFGKLFAVIGTHLTYFFPNVLYISAVAIPLSRPDSVSAHWVTFELVFSMLPAFWSQPILSICDAAWLSQASRRLVCLSFCAAASPAANVACDWFCGNEFRNTIALPTAATNSSTATTTSSSSSSSSTTSSGTGGGGGGKLFGFASSQQHLLGDDIATAAEHCVVFILLLLYKLTYIGAPETTGIHTSSTFSRFMRRTFLTAMERYFSLRIFAEPSCVVVPRSPEEDDDDDDEEKLRSENFMFGFHPHGILAVSCAWVPISKVWRSIGLPRQVTRFGASIIFGMVWIRDIAMTLGMRVVTREAIVRTLTEQNGKLSAMVVPGGQAEMLESRSSDTNVTLKNHHIGFLRIALQLNKKAVPVFCFGEHDIMDNIQMPKMQLFFLKLIGFGLPVLPYGLGGVLPLPRQRPLTVVVGKPVDPAEVKKRWEAKQKQQQQQQQQQQPAKTDREIESEQVQLFGQMYFEEIRRVFYKYRTDAGYPNLELQFRGRD